MSNKILSKDRLLLMSPEQRRLHRLSESGFGGDVLDEKAEGGAPVAWFDGAFDENVQRKVYEFMKSEGLLALNELDQVQHSGQDWTWPLTHLPGIGWFFKGLFAILGVGIMGLNTLLIFQKIKRLMRRLVYRTEFGKEKRFCIIPEIFRKSETPPCYDQLERNMERTVYTQTNMILASIGHTGAIPSDKNNGEDE